MFPDHFAERSLCIKKSTANHFKVRLMQFSEISLYFLMYLFTSFSEEKLCPLRASIDILEGEYFFLCYLESRQEHFQEEAYTVNWYKESAGKQQQIKETRRIVSQMNFLEFWPAELSDSGNYSVIHRWVHNTMGKCLACARL